MILISCGFRTSAQELKVTEFRIDRKDISARQNVVEDANGDACGIIKLRSGLQNLKFTADLGIRKTEIHEGEYWLWVSPNTQTLEISDEGSGNVQFKLPQPTEEFGVYIIILNATLPDKEVFKRIYTYVLQSKPSKAEVYVNNFYFGKTPAVINIPSDTIRYNIRKKKYLPLNGEYIYKVNENWFSVKLERDPGENMIYILPFVSGGNSYSTPIFGVEAGKIGKTGWYISFVPPLRYKKYIATYYGWEDYNSAFTLDKVKFSSVIGDDADKYYVQLKDKNNTFNNNFRLKVGINSKVFNNAYFKAGIGFASVRECFRLKVIPYSNDPLSEIPLKKTYYGRREDAILTLAFETGLIYRIKGHYLVSLNIASTGFSVWFTNNFVDGFLPLEAALGFGYRF